MLRDQNDKGSPAMQVTPYISFDGRCEEAIEHYKRVLGAEVTALMRWKEMPDAEPGMIAPGNENKIMHGELRIGQSTVMVSDGDCQGKPTFAGVSLTLSVADVAEAERLFPAIGEGGQVRMPLTETFFASRFGTVADRFGVTWMVVVNP